MYTICNSVHELERRRAPAHTLLGPKKTHAKKATRFSHGRSRDVVLDVVLDSQALLDALVVLDSHALL